VLLQWTRIGCIGFGGPPTHIALLRRLCVDQRGWLASADFEDAVAACSLLPGPASTQLAIYCAWRVRGRLGALAGAVGFIVPGLILILALAALFLGSPPLWIRGAGAGAGSAVAAVAVHAGLGLVKPSLKRAGNMLRSGWGVYALLGAAAAATTGSWLVLVLLGCGGFAWLRAKTGTATAALRAVLPLPIVASVGTGGTLSLAWVALKVGALSFGGGFVIIPLMQGDAVGRYHWLTSEGFLNAVALGQITPGPVVQTVSVVGYAAAGLTGGLIAALVAFTPSLAFVLLLGPRFDRLRSSSATQSFLNGAGPAAIGAILGSAIVLARSLAEPWEFVVLAGAAVLLLGLRRGVVPTLLLAAAAGAAVVLAGGALPS
jgi:chromate transporter